MTSIGLGGCLVGLVATAVGIVLIRHVVQVLDRLEEEESRGPS